MVNFGNEPHSKKPDAYMHLVIQMSGFLSLLVLILETVKHSESDD